MTTQEARAELTSYLRLKAIAENRRRRISELEYQLQSVRISRYGKLKGRNPDYAEELIDRLTKLKYQYIADTVAAEECAAVILRKIERITYLRYYTILYDVYIRGIRYYQVARDSHYSYDGVKKLIRRAVQTYSTLN